MCIRDRPKTYDPTAVESRLYEKWESEGLFKPADHKPEGAKPFCIVMPPDVYKRQARSR